MKAQVTSRRKGASNTRTSGEGKIDKSKRCGHQEDDNLEIKAYLCKLQNLVPFAPKNEKLSKLEVISNVIEYIHDLREILGVQRCNAVFDMNSMSQSGNVLHPSDIEIRNNTTSTVLSPISSPSGIPQSSPVLTQQVQNNRQPLGVICNSI